MCIIVVSLLLGFSQLFGEEFMIDCPKEITPEWEEKAFGIKYGVTTLDKAVEEMVSGVCDEYFDANFITKVKMEIEKNPKGEGEYLDYWENGQIKVRLPYKEGRAHGHVHGWYENGVDAFKGYFNQGVKQGVHMVFYPSKRDCKQKEGKIIRFNMKGQLNGELVFCYYHKTRILPKIIADYKNGKAHGEFSAWNKNKEEIFDVQYKKGRLQKKPPVRGGGSLVRLQDVAVRRMESRFFKKLYKEMGIYCEGSGGMRAFDIQSCFVQFRVKERATIERARELIVKITEMFKEEINKDEEIRPYLREYPFPHERIKVSVSFVDKRGYSYTDGSVAYCFYMDNSDEIDYEERAKDNGKLITLKKESYDEAFDKVFPQTRVKAENESRSDFNKG